MRSMVVLLAWAPLLVPAIPAQSSLPARAGFASETFFSLSSTPYVLHGVAADLRGQDVYCARFHEVVRIDAQGLTPIHAFAPGDQVGAVARPRLSLELLATDFTRDLLLRHHLLTAQSTVGPVPHNTFDLEVAPGGAILAAANPLWPQPGARTGVWLVDAAGRHREVIALRGPSGPLAFDAQGDLFCAVLPDLVPPPPGSVAMLRFAAARVQSAIAGGGALRESDGVVVGRGLDGAYDLVADDRGRLLVSDPQNGGIVRVEPATGQVVVVSPPPTPPATVTALSLQFQDLGVATFDPFQPRDGAALLVSASDWATTCYVFRLTAERPQLAVTPPQTGPGPVRFTVAGAPPGGLVALHLTGAAPVAERLLLELGGLPVWSSLDYRVPWFTAAASSDPLGGARFDFVYPGGFAGALHAEAFGLAPTAGELGSSPVRTVLLRP